MPSAWPTVGSLRKAGEPERREGLAEIPAGPIPFILPPKRRGGLKYRATTEYKNLF